MACTAKKSVCAIVTLNKIICLLHAKTTCTSCLSPLTKFCLTNAGNPAFEIPSWTRAAGGCARLSSWDDLDIAEQLHIALLVARPGREQTSERAVDHVETVLLEHSAPQPLQHHLEALRVTLQSPASRSRGRRVRNCPSCVLDLAVHARTWRQTPLCRRLVNLPSFGSATPQHLW